MLYVNCFLNCWTSLKRRMHSGFMSWHLTSSIVIELIIMTNNGTDQRKLYLDTYVDFFYWKVWTMKDEAAKCWRYEFEIHKGQHRLPTPRILAISTSKLCCCIKVSKVLMLTVWVGWLLNISSLHVHEFEKRNKNAHFDQRAKIALSWFQREIDLGWQFALN